VTLAGLGLFGAAVWWFAGEGPSFGALAGVLALLVAAALCEAFPVPIEGMSGSVSLAATFVVGAAIIYGWGAAVVVGFLARAIVESSTRRPPVRLAYNSAVYALAGGAAGGAAAPLAGRANVGMLVLTVLVGSTAFYAVNVPCVTAVIALWRKEPFMGVLRHTTYWTSIPFAIMSSLTLLLVAVWPRSPFLAAGLLGPLVAAGLYQRSVNRALKAMQLALTDPLTALGNHRHFQERLQSELDRADAEGTPVALCVFDLDNFKEINDRFGHPAGDALLAEIGTHLRHSGEAFRLGGDEFALLLVGASSWEARSVAEAVVERLAAADYEHGQTVSFSGGVASYPQRDVERSEFVRAADVALYWAKAEGKNRARVYRPGMGEPRQQSRKPDRVSRLRAAATLAQAVDARDAYTGSHSQRVADLAARVALRLGFDEEQVDLVRLAGSLHDVGKLGIPQEVLRKRATLNDAERRLLERHPEIGFQMLEPLDVEPVATWVLHHHERWDGRGYPGQLAGDRIPLAARILFVADAYDAMTTDLLYRPRLTGAEALDDLRRNAATQFDPAVVAAALAELDEPQAQQAPVVRITA